MITVCTCSRTGDSWSLFHPLHIFVQVTTPSQKQQAPEQSSSFPKQCAHTSHCPVHARKRLCTTHFLHCIHNTAKQFTVTGNGYGLLVSSPGATCDLLSNSPIILSTTHLIMPGYMSKLGYDNSITYDVVILHLQNYYRLAAL
jgi:hypothetical protein